MKGSEADKGLINTNDLSQINILQSKLAQIWTTNYANACSDVICAAEKRI